MYIYTELRRIQIFQQGDDRGRISDLFGASNRSESILLVVSPKLDGVSPVDNRPSTNKLQKFVRKKEKNLHMTCDT